MSNEYLTQNGISKLLQNIPSTVQIIDFLLKPKQHSQYFLIQVSDGYAFLKRCAIVFEDNSTKPRVKLYDVIRIQRVQTNIKKGLIVHTLIEDYVLLRNDIGGLIGKPIEHTLIKSIKDNPDGDNLIPPRKNNANKPSVQQKFKTNQTLIDDSFWQDQLKPPQKAYENNQNVKGQQKMNPNSNMRINSQKNGTVINEKSNNLGRKNQSIGKKNNKFQNQISQDQQTAYEQTQFYTQTNRVNNVRKPGPKVQQRNAYNKLSNDSSNNYSNNRANNYSNNSSNNYSNNVQRNTLNNVQSSNISRNIQKKQPPRVQAQKKQLDSRPQLSNASIRQANQSKGNLSKKKQGNLVNKQSPKVNLSVSKGYHDDNYTALNELYQGIQNWKLKVRVIFRTPVRAFTKKSNGQDSQVFSFQACDLKELIQFTVFGQPATRISDAIVLDQVYQIEKGKVVKDTQNNKLKVNLNQRSLINLMIDDLTIPMVEDFCLTPAQLADKAIGSEWNVVAIVKDQQGIIDFVSKAGNQCRKKEIHLCDPQAKIQLPLTLWFQKAQTKFEKIPYAMQGVIVSSFNEKKQFAAAKHFSFRECRQHQYRKYVGTIDKMKLQNPIPGMPSKKQLDPNIYSLAKFQKETSKLQGFNTLSFQKMLYIGVVTTSTKNTYLSCPYCKKKVLVQQNGQCNFVKCGKPYERGVYRFLLNIGLVDQSGLIWVTAFDQAAQVILANQDGINFTADQYVRASEFQIKQRINMALDKEFKVFITGKMETYNMQTRPKYTTGKVTKNVNFASEASSLIKKLQFFMSNTNKSGKNYQQQLII